MAGVVHYPCIWRRKNGLNQQATEKVMVGEKKKTKHSLSLYEEIDIR